MTNDFYTKYAEQINRAIDRKSVKYSIGTNPSAHITVHCYYVDKKDISIAAYATYDTASKHIKGYRATITVHSSEPQEQQTNPKIAERLYTKLYDMYYKRVAQSCLKHNFVNTAFVKKR